VEIRFFVHSAHKYTRRLMCVWNPHTSSPRVANEEIAVPVLLV
jgi:hypothetical protein